MPTSWLIFGATMQVLFLGRAVLQWLASERARDSVVPAAFWWISIAASGGLGLYFLRAGDPVGVFGQLVGLVVAMRNLVIIRLTSQRRWPWVLALTLGTAGCTCWLWVQPPFGMHDAGVPVAWHVYGWIAQAVFAGRWLVQWHAAEREHRSVTPALFWWCNVFGGLALLAYFARRGDPIGIAGQLFNSVLALRNLALVRGQHTAPLPVPLPEPAPLRHRRASLPAGPMAAVLSALRPHRDRHATATG